VTELVIVSKPRMRYVKWIGGGVYKTFLPQVTYSTITIPKSPSFSAFAETATPIYSTYPRVAQQIIAPTSGNPRLGRVVVKLSKTGSPTGTLYIRLYSDNNDVPGSALTTIASVDVSTLSTSSTTYTYDYTYQLTAGAKYWIVLEYTGGSSSNYVNAYVDNTTDRDPSVKGASYSTSWNVSNYDYAIVAGFIVDYSTPIDFIYSGPATKRLRINEFVNNATVVSRTINNQSYDSAVTETTSIPQADNYNIVYSVKWSASSILYTASYYHQIQRYLYYTATSITLSQLGFSDAYVWQITFGSSGGQLRFDDNPDADLIAGGNTTITFTDVLVPFRKLEWIQGGGEVGILGVE